ncbi:glutamine amidotransferase-related protein [Dyadobacter sandarakinus]|uniref:Amidotransferase n=1 Tax=Dyadobacter sandarakinus TaxID=2747268 RepID=A0ABX7ID57_9BACT|nr:amidotransferase [Dyadobacter sandarakinus]QRR03457.1 amidotransferase [Dyadobacter sandarakinus]
MRVGLLECDHVRPELLDIAGDYREMFPALFSAAGWTFQFYDVCNGHFPENAAACDVYLCTGSKYSVYDTEDWILRLKDFVNEVYHSDSFYIGVCFGHQMLGEALGGKVEKSALGWCVGMHSFEIVRRENWMEPWQSELNLLMMCQDQVTELPAGSTLLATTPACPTGMFRVGERMLGIQAHPEFTKAYDQALMELRVERIGQEKVENGIASLQKSMHSKVIAEWIGRFISL